MSTGRALILATFVSAGVGLVSACSEGTRYRVLSYFFDGVPDPEAVRAAEAAAKAAAEAKAVEAANEPEAFVRASFVHPPYGRGECGGCHDIRSGGRLVRSPQEGLCRTCHAAVVNDVRFAHGPAAVQDCVFCHHYHAAPYPHVVRQEIPALCYRCHDADDAAQGEHHADLDTENCVQCHSPHGGDDRFFLKRSDL